MSAFSAKQVELLLRGINPDRVVQREQAGVKLHYLTQADVRAHLIRMFGFGGYCLDVKSIETLFENTVPGNQGRENWHVGVRAVVRLSIESAPSWVWYEDSAVGGSTQPQRHEALDMATKTAVSDAMKRCAVNLGDQFGLSLYFNGSTHPVVGFLAEPSEPTKEADGPGSPASVRTEKAE